MIFDVCLAVYIGYTEYEIFRYCINMYLFNQMIFQLGEILKFLYQTYIIMRYNSLWCVIRSIILILFIF